MSVMAGREGEEGGKERGERKKDGDQGEERGGGKRDEDGRG